MLGITSPLTSCCEPFRLESHLQLSSTKTHLPSTSGWCCQGKVILEFPDHWLLTAVVLGPLAALLVVEMIRLILMTNRMHVRTSGLLS